MEFHDFLSLKPCVTSDTQIIMLGNNLKQHLECYEFSFFFKCMKFESSYLWVLLQTATVVICHDLKALVTLFSFKKILNCQVLKAIWIFDGVHKLSSKNITPQRYRLAPPLTQCTGIMRLRDAKLNFYRYLDGTRVTLFIFALFVGIPLQ